jgi:hypothetical protein
MSHNKTANYFEVNIAFFEYPVQLLFCAKLHCVNNIRVQ